MEGHYQIGDISNRSDFVSLWGEFLLEARKGGSSLHADDHNLKIYRDYFDAYAKGDLRGIAVLWKPTLADAPVAILLGGEAYGEAMWHDDHAGDHLANMWGIYVQPEFRKDGLALQLCEYAVPYLKTIGFRGAFTTVRVDNPMGMAMRETLEKLAMIRPLTLGYAGYWDEEDEA